MKTRKIIGCNKLPKYDNLASSPLHTTYLMLLFKFKTQHTHKNKLYFMVQ